MPNKNPLRRLSVALRLTEAYEPTHIPASSSSRSSLSVYLANAKANYLKDIKEDPKKGAGWTVVMGNEAGDLDSVASSIAFAWIQSEIHKQPTIPLIQVERADLNLRVENLYALSLAGLSPTQDDLLTMTELSDFKPFPSQMFALVDHNRLGSAFSLDNPRAEVIAVVDHHQDEGLYPQANPRIISPSGSCSSHVATLCPSELPEELATLLLTAIIIDTDGLKPGGKAIDLDRASAVSLASKSTMANFIPPPSALSPIDRPNPNALYDCQVIKELTTTLITKKSDVSHLRAFDLLRRDYKEATYTLTWAPGQPSIKAGLSTVPLRLKAWGSNGRLEADAITWMRRRGVTILGVLTSFHETKVNTFTRNGKGKHKREMAWIVLEETELSPIPSSSDSLCALVLANRLWAGLEANDDIKVQKYKKFDLQKTGNLPPTSKAMVYKQGNAHATRKIIAPILKNILEG
ncbi:exopolyphosphatase [Phlegmacium glaucopus]|nr:exopolyphosphatase [Phlegmacium glaucopus]